MEQPLDRCANVPLSILSDFVDVQWSVLNTQRVPRTVGGVEYYALGLEFGMGSFHASPNPERDEMEGLQEWSIDDPNSNSLPAVFQRVGENQFSLDLEHATEDDCLKDWLSQEQDILSIGGYFYENDVERNYDQSLLFQEFD